MKLEDFEIGTEFMTCTGQRWRCTDVGERTILAIELKQDLDKAWWIGPPYVVPEVPFDEIEIARAYRTMDEAIRASLDAHDRSGHPGYPSEAVSKMVRARMQAKAECYPHLGLFRIDRVDQEGEILHPFAAELVNGSWQIRVYLPFREQFRSVPESDFIRFRSANEIDLRRRAQRKGA